jgi:hypothetical protein
MFAGIARPSYTWLLCKATHSYVLTWTPRTAYCSLNHTWVLLLHFGFQCLPLDTQDIDIFPLQHAANHTQNRCRIIDPSPGSPNTTCTTQTTLHENENECSCACHSEMILKTVPSFSPLSMSMAQDPPCLLATRNWLANWPVCRSALSRFAQTRVVWCAPYKQCAKAQSAISQWTIKHETTDSSANKPCSAREDVLGA